MQILSVLPIARGIRTSELSYYAAEKIPAGTLVLVPLRRKKIPAIVVDCVPAREMKSLLKVSPFSLKSVRVESGKKFFSDTCLMAAAETARFHIGSVGEILTHIAPLRLLSAPEKIPPAPELSRNVSPVELFLAPTARIAERRGAALGGGAALLLHGELSLRRARGAWARALTDPSVRTIIATAGYVSIPHPNIASITILDPEHSAHTLRRRPYPDMRVFMRRYAAALCVPYREESLGETAYPRTISVIDMRKHNDPIFSSEAKNILAKTEKTDERVFVFSARRGLAPHTTCRDCGKTVSCETCGEPLLLRTTVRGRWYRCGRCRKDIPPRDTCASCGGWRLIELGIGSERVEARARELFPTRSVFRIDGDTAPTAAKARAIISEFEKNTNAILIGTELALNHTERPVSHAVVASLDSVLAIPDYHLPLRAMRILERLGECATESVVIQTRRPDEAIFSFFERRDGAGFRTADDAMRKKYRYPPRAILIKISGPPGRIQNLESELAAYAPITYEPLGAPNARLNMLIKLDPASWNAETGSHDERLHVLLSSLPPNIRVEVNPASVVA